MLGKRELAKSYFGHVECQVSGDLSSDSALTKTLAPLPGRDRVALYAAEIGFLHVLACPTLHAAEIGFRGLVISSNQNKDALLMHKG